MYKTIRSKPYFNRIRRALSFVAFSWLLYTAFSQVSLIDRSSLPELSSLFYALTLVSILSFANLSCETKKWLSLMRGSLSFMEAFKGVLAGMYSGFFTPNRIGEFTGRIALVLPDQRISAASATFIGSFLQGIVTVILGGFALTVLSLPNFTFGFESSSILSLVVIITLITSIVLFRKKLHSSVKTYFDDIRKSVSETSLSQLFRALFWAILRYAVFSTQLVLVLNALGFEGSLIQAYSGVALLYLVQTYFPLAIGGETGVREVLAVIIFAPFFSIPINAAVATIIVWFVNIIIPVFFGSLVFNKALKAPLPQV